MTAEGIWCKLTNEKVQVESCTENNSGAVSIVELRRIDYLDDSVMS